MKGTESAVSDIRSAFESNPFPRDFLAAYDQIECLASHYGRETFLVQKKNSDELFVAKCYELAAFSFSPGADLTKGFDHRGLPCYVDRFQNDKMLCLVREYVEGIPLNEYAAGRALSVPEITDICTKMCDILIYLHERRWPIIHRDIKPSNIIVQDDGNIVLIDFDIARMFRDGVSEDTVFFGTKGYAPPEQYGFAQTDCRSDVYSLGILLRYLLTGSIRDNPNIQVRGGLRRVIDRCTAFSPKDRYRNMRTVKAALRSPGLRPAITMRQAAIGAAAVLFFLLLGFFIGRETSLFAESKQAIAFSEPLMEEAVRVQLGLEPEADLDQRELLKVTRLYIYGTRVFREGEEFFAQRIDQMTRGQMRSLSDLRLLPNLEELYVVYQGELDISALTFARNLRSVEIKHTPVSDCSSVAELKKLRHIGLFDTDTADFTALEVCTRLESLDVGLTLAASMEQIGTYPYLESLGLQWLKMDSLDGLEEMTRLKTIFLQHAQIADMSVLTSLPDLEVVYAGEDNENQIREALKDTDISVILDE